MHCGSMEHAQLSSGSTIEDRARGADLLEAECAREHVLRLSHVYLLYGTCLELIGQYVNLDIYRP